MTDRAAMITDDSFVVVGAGLPGIVAALTLAGKGHHCVLLEAAPNIGGLLRSYEVDGETYDFGTHFANLTGIDELDRLLFDDREDAWVEYPVLLAGNVWNGQLNEVSENPDLNSVSQEIHYRCLAELLSAPGWQGSNKPENAQEFLISEYGKKLVDVFFNPVLQKFTGKTANALFYKANLLFNLKRFAVLDLLATDELKMSSKFDSRVAFHHRNDYKFHRPCLYPKSGGIGRWIEVLESKLTIAGVDVRTNAHIESVDIVDHNINELIVDGQSIGVKNLLWSAAPATFCRLAGQDIGTVKPEFRSTILVGLVFDRKFLTDCHYITVFDPNFHSFRITLYNNFRLIETNFFTATVEFLVSPEKIDSLDWMSVAVDEMMKMGLCNSGAIIKKHHIKIISNGFPVQSNQSIENMDEHLKKVKAFKNLHLIGRAGGEGWFLDGLIRQAYETASIIG